MSRTLWKTVAELWCCGPGITDCAVFSNFISFHKNLSSICCIWQTNNDFFLSLLYLKQRNLVTIFAVQRLNSHFQYKSAAACQMLGQLHRHTQVRSEWQRCQASNVIVFLFFHQSKLHWGFMKLSWESIRKLRNLQFAFTSELHECWSCLFESISIYMSRDLILDWGLNYSNAQFDVILQMTVWTADI